MLHNHGKGGYFYPFIVTYANLASAKMGPDLMLLLLETYYSLLRISCRRSINRRWIYRTSYYTKTTQSISYRMLHPIHRVRCFRTVHGGKNLRTKRRSGTTWYFMSLSLLFINSNAVIYHYDILKGDDGTTWSGRAHGEAGDGRVHGRLNGRRNVE